MFWRAVFLTTRDLGRLEMLNKGLVLSRIRGFLPASSKRWQQQQGRQDCGGAMWL